MTETTIKRKRKREELYKESLYVGEPYWIQALRFVWRLVTAPVSWSWNLVTRLLAATWRGTKSAVGWTLRSSWKVTAWAFRGAWDATVWAVRLPFRAWNWLWQLVFGPPVRFSDPRYAEIYALIARRYRRRSRFITHLFAFILVNVGFWADLFYKQALYAPNYPVTYARSLVVFTAAWAFVLLFHFIHMKHGVEEDQAIEQAIEREREWERVQRRDYPDDERYLRLADDGEALELREFMDEASWEKRKNRN